MASLRQIRESAERLTGTAIVPRAERDRLQETEQELRGKTRELQDLAYSVLDYAQGSPQELKAQERRHLAQRARIVWQQDPQYGGTINLLNEFVLGRGIPKPQAVDEEVQDLIDEFWEDPDNQRVITTHAAQVRFNTDLSLQSNVFPLVYDEGEDGQVKLGLLDHDTVEQAVRDPDARLRVLYYFTKSYDRIWDVTQHAYKVSREREKMRYYEEFRNLKDAEADDDEGLRKEPLPDIPEDLIGRGRVLHIAINRTMEQAFGVPEIARTLRWLTAYNDLMRARVDMAKAAAAIIMRRKLKGGAAAAQNIASQALLQTGVSGNLPVDPMALGQAPRPGAIIEENDAVEHQAFNLNSGSQGAMQDAQMIRSQYSVGVGWPQSYLGDPSSTNLSTATTLELRVLKMVEARQQVLEDLIRTLINHKIRRALETKRLEKFRPQTAEERKRDAMKKRSEEQAEAEAQGQPSLAQATQQAAVNGMAALHMIGTTSDEDDEEAPKGQVLRDFTFQVSMPSPLRRAMGDLLTGVSLIAKTFDPNATNLELSRTLLGIALGEGLEMEDPAAAVERILPEGYVDPMVAAAQAQAQQLPQMPPGSFGTEDEPGFGSPGPFPGMEGPNGDRHPADNAYGAPQKSRNPALSMQQAEVREAVNGVADALADRRLVQLYGREGQALAPEIQEAIVQRAVQRISPTQNGRERAQALGDGQASYSDVLADSILGPAMMKAFAALQTHS